MSTSVNGKLDYFGRSVAVASALLNTSEHHRLIMTQELASDDDCRTQLAAAHKDLKIIPSSGGIGIFEICDHLANTFDHQPGVTANADLYPIDSLQNDTTLQLAAKPLSPETEAQS